MKKHLSPVYFEKKKCLDFSKYIIVPLGGGEDIL